MRDKADPRLDASIKDFFSKVKEDNETQDDAENQDEDEDDFIVKKVSGKRVQMLNDTLITDYISISNWRYNNDDWYFPDDEVFDEEEDAEKDTSP